MSMLHRLLSRSARRRQHRSSSGLSRLFLPSYLRSPSSPTSSSFSHPHAVFLNSESSSTLAPSSSLASWTRSLSHVPKSTDLTLKCTEMDSKGTITTTAGDFSKADLCNRYDVQVRDLRKLDDSLSLQLPAILVRPSVILINLGVFKAIIQHDHLVLFEPVSKSSAYDLSRLIFDMQGVLKTTAASPSKSGLFHVPFEFKALEVFLTHTISQLNDEADHLLPKVEQFLTSKIAVHAVDKDMLTSLLQYSKRISQFHTKVGSFRQAIMDVLNSDEDLANMYLTDKAEGRPHSIDQHEEVEILFETYLKQTEEILARVAMIEDNIQTTEDIINISLDSQRNALLFLEIRLTMGTFAVTSGAMVMAAFGMNLTSGYETSPGAFWMATGTATTLSALVFATFWRQMRKISYDPTSLMNIRMLPFPSPKPRKLK